jgi:hypothetical protein
VRSKVLVLLILSAGIFILGATWLPPVTDAVLSVVVIGVVVAIAFFVHAVSGSHDHKSHD